MNPLNVIILIALFWLAVTFFVAWRHRFRWWGYVGMYVLAAVLTDLTLRLLALVTDA